MQAYVRDKLDEAIQSCQGEYTVEDLTRSFAREATLMHKTDEVVRTLESDPYEHLGDIQSSLQQRLCPLLRVVAWDKVLTKAGHCRIAGTVAIRPDVKMNEVGVAKYVELCFEYERDGTQNPGESTSVWYSIDVARDDGPREKILWVKVFAAGSVPSTLPAKDMDDEEEDGWEDIEEEDEEEENDDNESTEQAESKMKKARIQVEESQEDETMEEMDEEQGQDVDEEDTPTRDRFTAGIDPEAMEQFLHWTQLGKMQDATAFFLLMSFPFYEVEFDITGFILDAVFGPDDGDDSDDNGTEAS